MRLSGKIAALALVAAFGAQSAHAATIDVDNLLEGPPRLLGGATTNGYAGGKAFTLMGSHLYGWGYDMNFRT